MNYYTSNNLQKEMEIKEVQYQKLQAQINPHFLYNTLNSIRWMAIMIKAENIKLAIDAFWSISKYNFETEEKYITVQEEIEILKKYIYLQQIAYKNAFEVKWIFDEDVLKFRCIKFFLQPLVENAIKHGILQSKKIGIIRISIEEKEKEIVFIISDNGTGMDENKKERIFKDELKPSGLSNVLYRLKLAYDTNFNFIIESKEKEYTTLEITIPKDTHRSG